MNTFNMPHLHFFTYFSLFEPRYFQGAVNFCKKMLPHEEHTGFKQDADNWYF